MKLITTFILAVGVANYASAGMIDNFERGTLGSNWVSQSRSVLSLSAAKANSGQKSLLWSYAYDGSEKYLNDVVMNFAPQNWSQATKLTFSISTGNMNGLTNPLIACLYYNSDGAHPTYATYFTLDTTQTSAGFVTETINLPAIPNQFNSVNQIKFYINGDGYKSNGTGGGPGTYEFYIDDISINTPVPEAASLTALAAPIGLVLLRRRGKKTSDRA